MTEQSNAEYDIPQPTLRFKSVGHESSDGNLPKDPNTPSDHSPSMGTSTVTIKQEGDDDVKPKLATSIHSASHLRQMLGGTADCMITRVRCRNDPYCEFEVNDPLTQEEIILSSEEESEVDDLDEVSLDSRPITNKELQEVLTKLANSHKATGEHLTTLAQMASEMTVDQIDTTTTTVSAELQGCPGLQAMFDRYDPSKILLILAIGCKNYKETEKVKGHWEKPISYDPLVKVFGIGKQQIQDGCTRMSYQSSGQESKPPTAE